MSVQYTPIPINEDAISPKQLSTSFPRWKASLALISLLNIGALLTSLQMWRAAGKLTNITNLAHPTVLPLPDGLARTEELPLVYTPFRWHTPWSSSNTTEADTLWDNINTAHGHIAIDHEWAASNHWLPSMNIPGRPGKGMYLLQAYHQLHCLRVVRHTLLELYRGIQPFRYPIDHNMHCFDALRQHIMCHADSTPLYGHGDHTAGDGQLHQCRDWTALREYATQHTACFRDGKPGMTFEDHFGHCDDGTDGLEVQSATGSR